MNNKQNSHKLNKRWNLQPFVLLLCIILLLSCATYVVYARYIHQTEEEVNNLTESYVSCAGTEEITEVTEIVGTETVTKTHKTSLTVSNTGNVTSYIRVQLVSYWQDASGNIIARNSITPVGSANGTTTDTTFVLNEGWIAVEQSDGSYYYYYTKPVAAGEAVPNLIADGSYITLVTEDEYDQVVEILAEAIQAEPTTAVEEAWTKVGVAQDGTLEAR